MVSSFVSGFIHIGMLVNKCQKFLKYFFIVANSEDPNWHPQVCFQLQAKVCAQITGKPLVQACPGKSVVR